MIPYSDVRPIVGLRPVRFCWLDGLVIEPPVWVPMLEQASRPATAVAEPDDEPPGSYAGVFGVHALTVVTSAVRRGRTGRGERAHLGLAEDHRAGLEQPRHARRVLVGHEPLEDVRVRRGLDALRPVVVLDHDRHAVEDARGPSAIERPRARERLLGEYRVERQVGAIEALDSLQVRADRLLRRDPAPPDRRRRLRERELREVLEIVRQGRGDGAAARTRLRGGGHAAGGDRGGGRHPGQERPAVELRVERRVGHRVHALNGAG